MNIQNTYQVNGLVHRSLALFLFLNCLSFSCFTGFAESSSLEPSQIELVAAQKIDAGSIVSYAYEAASLTCISELQYGSREYEYEANILLTHQRLAHTVFKSVFEELFAFSLPFFFLQNSASRHSEDELPPVL